MTLKLQLLCLLRKSVHKEILLLIVRGYVRENARINENFPHFQRKTL